MSQFARNSLRIVHPIAHTAPRHYRSLRSSQRHFSSLNTSSSSSSSSSSRPSVPAFVFDIDGVLIRGKALLPTARDALRKVTRREDGGVHPTGLPHIFLTNGGGVTEHQKAKQLSELFGVHVKPENVILSHTPMLDLLDEYRHVPVLTLGMTDVRSVAESYGFEKVLIPEDLIAQHPDLVPHLTEHARAKVHKMANPDTNTALESIRAIFVMHDPNEWYRDLQLTMDLLTMHITKATRSSNQPTETPLTPPKIYFSNPDFLFTGKAKHPRLAQGAFRVCLQALYETFTGEPLPMKLYGKPNAVTYRYAERTLARQAEEFGVTISHYYGIGDNPASDIRGANLAGPHWSSIFVQTGTIAKSKHQEEQPKYELACVNEAVDFIIKKEDETQK